MDMEIKRPAKLSSRDAQPIIPPDLAHKAAQGR